MDWKKCTLCQTGGEDLVDSLQNRNSDVDGYMKLAANIKFFLDRKCTTSLNDLKGDIDIASNLQKVKAKWPKDVPSKSQLQI